MEVKRNFLTLEEIEGNGYLTFHEVQKKVKNGKFHRKRMRQWEVEGKLDRILVGRGVNN